MFLGDYQGCQRASVRVGLVWRETYCFGIIASVGCIIHWVASILNKHLSPDICERLVKNGGDMGEIEDSIIRHLGGENHLCAFFRSVPYIRLRVSTL